MSKFIWGISGLLTGAGLMALFAFFPLASPTSNKSGASSQSMGSMNHTMTMQTESSEMMHEHPIRNIDPASPVPTIRHLVFPDVMDGYNIQILSQNFKITPAAINREVVENEGHAHLYVNGNKVSRIYSNWYHLPANKLNDGVNLVSVTLNANDHSEWAVDGKVIASTVRVMK